MWPFCFTKSPVSTLVDVEGGREVRKVVSGIFIPMQMTVPALCAFTSSPSNTPGRLMASWTAFDRGTSKGSAMLTWPTMPFSKNVHDRTWSSFVSFGRHGLLPCSVSLSSNLCQSSTLPVILDPPHPMSFHLSSKEQTHPLGPINNPARHQEIPRLHLLP